IEASHKGMTTAYGSDFLKEPVPITEHRYDTASSVFSVSFTDPPGRGDYYRIRFIMNNSAKNYYRNYFSTKDPSVEFFSDEDILGIDLDFEGSGENFGFTWFLSDRSEGR